MELIAAMLGAGPAEGGPGERLAALADADLHAVMQERTSSHLMEVRPQGSAVNLAAACHESVASFLPRKKITARLAQLRPGPGSKP